MWIYYAIWGIVTAFSFVEVVMDHMLKYRKLYGALLWSIWCVFLLLVCFKGNVGTDYNSYMRLFEDASSEFYSFSASSIEPLYWLWMKFFSVIVCSFPLFWLVTSFVNISLKFYLIKYLSPYVGASILIYLVGLFFERDFDGIRQGLSIGLGYLACVQYLKYKKNYLLLVISAALIHYTSILFFLIPLLTKVHLSKRTIFLLLIAGFICSLLRLDVIGFFFSLIGGDNFLYDKMYSYLHSDIYAKSIGINIGVIFRVITLLLFMKYRSLFPMEERQYNLLLNGFFLSIVLSLFLSNMDILFHRLAYGFREFQIFIIPYLLYIVKGKRNRMVAIFIISLYSLLLLHRLLSIDISSYYIYKTIYE